MTERRKKNFPLPDTHDQRRDVPDSVIASPQASLARAKADARKAQLALAEAEAAVANAEQAIQDARRQAVVDNAKTLLLISTHSYEDCDDDNHWRHASDCVRCILLNVIDGQPLEVELSLHTGPAEFWQSSSC